MNDSYAAAGVNIDAGNEVVERIKDKVKKTHSSLVLSGIGGFGGLFDIKKAIEGYAEPVLVQSIDGVGTKLIVAQMMNKYDTVGKDIVNHCSNDIVAMGARPLTFLDYVAHQKLVPEVMEKMVIGMAESCIENKIALIGGETAEMPGVYLPGQHDIAGCITGVVDKSKIITGETIAAGDVIFGFASNGLHTNGYSLARKLFFETAKLNVTSTYQGMTETVGEALLKPHMNYTNPIFELLDNGVKVKGIAHITGGGFTDNIPRILPEGLDVIIKKGSWPILPIFTAMQSIGKISDEEMYRVFNMGIGMMFIVSPTDVEKVDLHLKKHPSFPYYRLGSVEKATQKVIIK